MSYYTYMIAASGILVVVGLGAWEFLRRLNARHKRAISWSHLDTSTITPVEGNTLERINYLALHDSLTGLPNRAMLFNQLENLVSTRLLSDNAPFAVLFIDLDRFKMFNDTYGHDFGDRVLEHIGDRLRSSVRQTETVFRLGGDEFVVIIYADASKEVCERICTRLLSYISKEMTVNDIVFSPSASVGISTFPTDGTDVQSLMKKADMAMYDAKESGRNGFRFFSQEMSDGLEEFFSIESSLRKALGYEEFDIVLQPQLDLASGSVTGAEVLLRWNHRKSGNVSPARFIPVAEETGFIAELGEYVLRRSFQTISRFSGKDWCSGLKFAINISAVQLRKGNLYDTITTLMHEYGISPSSIELEFTETMLIETIGDTLPMLTSLASTGISLALDDFGTGYSSLSYLRRFPVSVIKIDKSFVADMITDPEDYKIVQAVIEMGNILGKSIVAEGIETPEQLYELMSLGCHYGQGYYLSRPLTITAFEGYMDSHPAGGGSHIPEFNIKDV